MNLKILGMGNAVLDIVTSVSDEFLKSTNLSKGSMTLVDQKVSEKVLKEIDFIKKDSGGSVANTIASISLLGLSSFFCGKVKKDELGDEFVSDMQKTNTAFLCDQSPEGPPTARCIVFVTPDGERSMQTFLGASTTLAKEDIRKSFFEEVDYFLIEGYLWSSETARDAINQSLKFIKNKNIKVVFSLSDSGLVKMFKDDFLNFIHDNVDILIGNENEFDELFNGNDELNYIEKTKTEIVIKTKGERGAQIFQLNKVENISSCKVDSVVDTTGAGDMFAAGFLYKLLIGEDPKKAASFGCKVASLIIQQYGARLSKETLQASLNQKSD